MRKLRALVQPSNYYPLLLYHLGSDEAAINLKVNKRDFGALVQLVKGSGAQIVFSSVLPVAGSDAGRNRKTQLVNVWVCAWCYRQNFRFF